MEIGMSWTAIGTVIAIGALLHTMISNFKKELNERFDRIDNKLEKLSEKVNDLDKRLSRMEGIMHWLEKFIFDRNGSDHK